MTVTDQYQMLYGVTLHIVKSERDKLWEALQPVEGHPVLVECVRYIQVGQFGERLEKQVEVERLCLDVEASDGERSQPRTFYHISLQLGSS